MAGGDLAGAKTLRAAAGAWIFFEDEAGVTGRPPKGRAWGRRGITPRVKVSGRKGERRSLGESDSIHLLDGAHQLLKTHHGGGLVEQGS
ncbi:hypothetical protein ACFOZ0_30340 [Streptomyces yaanensis]|uniref:Transposase n=1 Tax=Streptomyces yaanensis TaxID=1142239 RepID=A0ABV7SKG7_9ACTN|nr:hypothetical protein [Streptomyces sp. CGMCC 4.7035]WNC00370.1 hypothetical protein Q2K21_21185 [Streptomyces sp. CGMCC 4.7035]